MLLPFSMNELDFHRNGDWKAFRFSRITVWMGPVLRVIGYWAITTYYALFITSC